MGAAPAADLNLIFDQLARFYRLAYGKTSTEVYGIGVSGGGFGAADAADDAKAAIVSLTEVDFILAIVAKIDELVDTTSAVVYTKAKLNPILSLINSHVAEFLPGSQTTIQGYLEYLNTALGTKWQALQHPDFREVLINSGVSSPAVNLFYEEILQGTVYANALRKEIVGTGETAGASVDGSKHAGGFPKLLVSGLTGSGTVEITGTQYDPATKLATAGKTWTATVNANGTVALTPGGAAAAATDSLIQACSAITVPGGISAGTIYVEAHRPTGRPLLP